LSFGKLSFFPKISLYISLKISYNKNTLNSRGRNMRKNTKLNFMYILIAIPIYFFSTIFINHFQQYEYIFTDVNNIKKYQVTSNNDASYAYIKLDNNLYTEGEFSAFEIRKVYEDEDYFIAYYFKEKKIK